MNLIMMNQEFETMEGELGIIEINTTVGWEHFGEFERNNRIVKEHCWAIPTTLPYSVLPK